MRNYMASVGLKPTRSIRRSTNSTSRTRRNFRAGWLLSQPATHPTKPPEKRKIVFGCRAYGIAVELAGDDRDASFRSKGPDDQPDHYEYPASDDGAVFSRIIESPSMRTQEQFGLQSRSCNRGGIVTAFCCENGRSRSVRLLPESDACSTSTWSRSGCLPTLARSLPRTRSQYEDFVRQMVLSLSRPGQGAFAIHYGASSHASLRYRYSEILQGASTAPE